jgi:glycosyltransferase involved in cell wall biosynthesis
MAPPDTLPRVAFLTSNLGMGGAERHVELVARALRSAGREVVVLCIEEGGPRAASLSAEGVDVTSLDAGDSWWLRAPSVIGRTVRTLRRSGAGVVMTNGYSAEIVGRIAGRIAGIPVIQWKHNIGHVGRFGLRDRWTERLMRPLRARVLAVSHAQIDYLTGFLKIPRERIGCIRNVLEPSFDARRDSGPGHNRPVVICVAGFRAEKDHTTLLHAFRTVVDAHPTAVLRLVGDGPERPAAEALAGELGIVDSVEFLGNRSDVEHLLPGADVFVLASYAVENLPFAVLEAMTAELPVVATDVGALAELVLDGVTGLLVPPRDPAALATALGQLLDAPDRAREMGRAGGEHLREQFAYSDFVARLEEEVLRCG